MKFSLSWLKDHLDTEAMRQIHHGRHNGSTTAILRYDEGTIDLESVER